MILFGNQNKRNNNDERYPFDGEKRNYVSYAVNDFNNVLAALFALHNKEQGAFIKECKELEKNGENHNNVPEMSIDKLIKIWNYIFPHRDIYFEDGRVICLYKKDDITRDYEGREMSDGERAALYLISQAICVPGDKKVIIIDEPELHLHHSIMNKILAAIEHERKDILFIYITHDTQFAANHRHAKKFWIREYDGTVWKWEEIQDSDLPEDLLLSILGNRKPVIFVEGTAGSYDTKLYSKIYEDYYVIPCGSCMEVIARTKAMKRSEQLHHLNCFGIIDRDYRSQQEIESLRDNGIYTLEVAEVENLFIIEEILKEVNSTLGFSDNSRIENVKNYITQNRYKNQMHKMIIESTISNIKYMLSTVDLSSKDETSLNTALNNVYSEITINNIKPNIDIMFKNALSNNNYREVLSLFNYKKLPASIGHYFGLNDDEYMDFIIRKINSQDSERWKSAIKNYLPDFSI